MDKICICHSLKTLHISVNIYSLCKDVSLIPCYLSEELFHEKIIIIFRIVISIM